MGSGRIVFPVSIFARGHGFLLWRAERHSVLGTQYSGKIEYLRLRERGAGGTKRATALLGGLFSGFFPGFPTLAGRYFSARAGTNCLRTVVKIDGASDSGRFVLFPDWGTLSATSTSDRGSGPMYMSFVMDASPTAGARASPMAEFRCIHSAPCGGYFCVNSLNGRILESG